MSRPHPRVVKRLALARSVANYAPGYRGVSRWGREMTLLASAYLYEHGPWDSPLDDHEFDALCKVLAGSRDTSPYFKECVNLRMLKTTTSGTAINWNKGIAQLTADMFKPGWNPQVQEQLDAERLAQFSKQLERYLAPVSAPKPRLVLLRR